MARTIGQPPLRDHHASGGPLKPTNKRRGLTLVELLIALSFASVVLFGVVQATQSGLGMLNENAIQSDVTMRSGRAMQRITSELYFAGASTLVPDLTPPLVGPDPGNSAVTFRCGDDYQAGALQWGAFRSLTWERAANDPDNGIDDDGDGLIDEGEVVLRRNVGAADEQRVVLVRDVPELLEGEASNALDDNGNGLFDEPGFCLSRDGNVVEISLTLQRPGRGGRPVIRTRTTSVLLRN